MRLSSCGEPADFPFADRTLEMNDAGKRIDAKEENE